MAQGDTARSTVCGGSKRSDALLDRYREVRRVTERLCEPLEVEDYVVQACAEASPAKWHLAHTAWFFENFVLAPFAPNYRPYHERFSYLFNSYYETVGTFFARPLRGLLSRPTVSEIYRYRRHVDERVGELLASGGATAEAVARTELGLHHEAQHQELIITDLKALYAMNPLRPAYLVRRAAPSPARSVQAPGWRRLQAGLNEIGHAGGGFCFDNELPRHPVFVQAAEVASQPVTNAEFMQFIEDGGYRRAELWLSDGWRTVSERNWSAPLYWERIGSDWWYYTLSGMRQVDAAAPVCHVSYFEADAYARWSGGRLPTEAEWETVAAGLPVQGNFLESGDFQPQQALAPRWYGDVWVWTQSAYGPYPGSVPAPGSLGEYNAKFMVNQIVLRGGSCASPAWHIRPTYRNFFYGPDRWQFTGIRLARNAQSD